MLRRYERRLRMQKYKEEENQIKILCIGMILVLVAVLIPLFWISTYNFLSVDDYSFAYTAAAAWKETHSIWKVLTAQMTETLKMYRTWQGTFFDIWFSGTLMGIFGESAYCVGTILSLGGFVMAECLLFMTILVSGLGADKCRAVIVSVSCASLQVLMTPNPVEGYFWFCGAIRYTFIHALLLVLLELLILFARVPQKKILVVLLDCGIIILSIAIGGGNYISALTMAMLYVLYVAWMFWKKNSHKFLAMCNMIVFFLAFGINMLAPGNNIRQAASGENHMSAIKSILVSLQEAGNYCIVNANPPCVILGLLLIPIFWKIVKERNYRYPKPFLITVFSFCIFAAQFTPNIYALQILGAGRVLNLYRLNFYVLIYANELYWIGWLWRRYRECHPEEMKAVNCQEVRNSYLLPGWIVGGIVLCLSLFAWGGQTLTTVSAVHSLRHGEAKQYRQEYEERLLLLENSDSKEAYLKHFSVKPYLLYFGDIVEDTEDWVNKAIATYYDKDIVGLQK